MRSPRSAQRAWMFSRVVTYNLQPIPGYYGSTNSIMCCQSEKILGLSSFHYLQSLIMLYDTNFIVFA